jgi:hypothetical protein
MDAEAAARNWIDGWSRGWPTEDADLIASLYTEDAVYWSHPFREPHVGSAGAHDYAAQAFLDETLVRCWFGEPVAVANRAAVEYWAILRTIDGKDRTLAGTTMLRFAPDGRVAEHREYWDMRDGASEPPEGWGR